MKSLLVALFLNVMLTTTLNCVLQEAATRQVSIECGSGWGAERRQRGHVSGPDRGPQRRRNSVFPPLNKKSQIYTAHFSFEKHLNNYWNSQKWKSNNIMHYYTLVHAPNSYQKQLFWTLYKIWYFNTAFDPTWKPYKNVHKSKSTCQTPIQYTTFHQYTSSRKTVYLQRYRPISTSTPNILPPVVGEYTELLEKFGLGKLEIGNRGLWLAWIMTKTNHRAC